MRKIIKQYSDLFKVELPIINELIKTKELKRLKYISYHCGMYYGPKDIYNFSECYTRLDHSINCSKMYYLLTKDIKGTVALLLHDISTPVFSHVIDIMKDDPINQEVTEEYNKDMIKNSKEIRNILDKYNIKLIDVIDVKNYSIADNKRPKLCIDRLDAVFIEALLWHKSANIKDIKYLFNNLRILNDEKEELGFNNLKQGLLFFNYSMKSAYLTDDYGDTYAMALLASLVKILIDNKKVKEEDLYKIKEKIMIRKLKYNKLTKKLYKKFINLQRKNIKLTNKKPKIKYYYSTETKRRYINPLVKDKGRIKRITYINNYCMKNLHNYLSLQRENYVYNEKIK